MNVERPAPSAEANRVARLEEKLYPFFGIVGSYRPQVPPNIHSGQVSLNALTSLRLS